MAESTATRREHDLLGDKQIPADAYYGVQTARGLENFHISGVQLQLYPDLIKALAMTWFTSPLDPNVSIRPRNTDTPLNASV